METRTMGWGAKLAFVAIAAWLAWSLYVGSQPDPTYVCRDREVAQFNADGSLGPSHTETVCRPH